MLPATAGGRGGGVEGGLRLAHGVDERGDAALVLQPVECGAEDLEVLTRVAARAHDGLPLLPATIASISYGYSCLASSSSRCSKLYYSLFPYGYSMVTASYLASSSSRCSRCARSMLRGIAEMSGMKTWVMG
eukprot:scaffold51602_cov54-Phaeocystis_antarctica.AAC.2